ncbi:Coenzyme PQQ synthesis protein E [uncultured archaeon]|nr:Coenzyme PQQ synthesis protein E [uncultured archaeon]
MKAVRGTPKHLSQNGELTGFTYLMLNLDYSCNYNCLKCFNQGESTPSYQKIELLSLKERIELIKQAKTLGGKAVVIAGEGEPSIHRDIKALVGGINSQGMIPIIYTNGALVTKELAEFYKKNNATIIISLDSLNPEKYDLMTGTKGQLQIVLRNIEQIREVYKNTAKKVKGLTILSLALNTTVSEINYKELEKIKDFCGEDIYFICNPLAKLGSAQETWKVLMKDKTPEDFAELISKMSESGGPLMLGKNMMCNYQTNGIAVSPWGHYMICAYTNLTNDLLGTIKDKTLGEAYKYKQKIEAEHTKKYGKANCFIRADSFTKYISTLKELI